MDITPQQALEKMLQKLIQLTYIQLTLTIIQEPASVLQMTQNHTLNQSIPQQKSHLLQLLILQDFGIKEVLL